MGRAQPWILDICCCQGGAARGYQIAGFKVYGVDTEAQPRYCGDRFKVADGLDVLTDTRFLRRFAAVHTSWPCQGYTEAQRLQGNDHPRLIEPGRKLVEATGLPYVQENVVGAPLLDPIMLCGAMFGIRTYRHRLFESNVPLAAPLHPDHARTTVKMGRPIKADDFYHAVGNFSGVEIVRRDLQVPWMDRDGIRECIPPAYAREIGAQLMRAVR